MFSFFNFGINFFMYIASSKNRQCSYTCIRIILWRVCDFVLVYLTIQWSLTFFEPSRSVPCNLFIYLFFFAKIDAIWRLWVDIFNINEHVFKEHKRALNLCRYIHIKTPFCKSFIITRRIKIWLNKKKRRRTSISRYDHFLIDCFFFFSSYNFFFVVPSSTSLDTILILFYLCSMYGVQRTSYKNEKKGEFNQMMGNQFKRIIFSFIDLIEIVYSH